MWELLTKKFNNISLKNMDFNIPISIYYSIIDCVTAKVMWHVHVKLIFLICILSALRHSYVCVNMYAWSETKELLVEITHFWNNVRKYWPIDYAMFLITMETTLCLGLWWHMTGEVSPLPICDYNYIWVITYVSQRN